MTRRGVILVILLALILSIGLGTGTREIYFAACCLLLLLLYSLASALLAAAALRCRQTLDAEQIVRGEQAGLCAAIEGLLLCPAVVRLHVRLPGYAAPVSKQFFQLTLLPGKRRPALTMRLPCPHRGIWPLGVDQVRAGDIFGVFAFPLLKKDALGGLEQGLTVFPQLYEAGGETRTPSLLDDESSSDTLSSDHGYSFAGTRLYRDGDSLKRIHWVQSIRTRELYTRQYELSARQYNLLVVDAGAPPGTDILSFADMAGECAAALAFFYLENGQPVQLRTAGPFETAVTAGDSGEFFGLYALLAEMPFDAVPDALDLSMLPDDNLGAVRSIHIITHRPSPALLETLRILALRRCLVSCLTPDTAYARELAAACPEEVRLLPVAQPADILTEWGDSL